MGRRKTDDEPVPCCQENEEQIKDVSKYIICMPGASKEDLRRMEDILLKSDKFVITNAGIKLYKIQKGIIYEVVEKLEMVQ